MISARISAKALWTRWPAVFNTARRAGLDGNRLRQYAAPVFASSNYPPDQEAADAFVGTMRHGTLIATPPGGHPQVSLLPFLLDGDTIELHCVQGDPTFAAVQENPVVTFLVSDFLAWSRHEWVDERDGAKATLHFRAVAFECVADFVSTEPDAVAAALRRLLDHYEPGASYEPVEDGDYYGPRLKRLATMRLRIVRRHVKLKVGPAAPAATKRRVVEGLRERSEPGDKRAADVIEATIRD